MNDNKIPSKIVALTEKIKSRLIKPRCDHSDGTPNSTLLFLDDTLMVYPPRRLAVCSICGKSFEFTVDLKGELKENDEEEKINEKGGNS